MQATIYDDQFNVYRGHIPLAYIRALAISESSLNSLAKSPVPGSSSVGLFGITRAVLADINVARPSLPDIQYPIEYADLLSPKVNTAVACWLLSRIELIYGSVWPAIKADWTSPAWPGLVTLGFKAGYSRVAGAALVLERMRESNIPPEKVNYLTVSAASKEIKGATKWLSDPAILTAVGRVLIGAGYIKPAYNRPGGNMLAWLIVFGAFGAVLLASK